MPLFNDAGGTIGSAFQIGVGGTGVRTLRFRNVVAAELTWNPTANRSIVLPDASGTLLLNDASNLVASITGIAGIAYTIAATDRGEVLEFSNTAAITVTLPNNLPVGFTCTIVQVNTGQVTLSPAAGATIRHPDGHTKTAKRWAIGSLYVRSNTGGTAAEWVWGGYTA